MKEEGNIKAVSIDNLLQPLPTGMHIEDIGDAARLPKPADLQCSECGAKRRPWMMYRKRRNGKQVVCPQCWDARQHKGAYCYECGDKKEQLNTVMQPITREFVTVCSACERNYVKRLNK
jgi:hypothetical protein